MKSLFSNLGILLLLLVLAFGCSSIDKLVQDGIGQPISMTIERWGPPSRVTPDGRGGSIYVWEGSQGNGYGTRRFWSTMFWVDSKGIIYKWR